MLTEYKRDSDFIYYTDGSHSFIGQRSESELQAEWDYYYPSGYPNEQKEVVEQKQNNQIVSFNNSTTSFNPDSRIAGLNPNDPIDKKVIARILRGKDKMRGLPNPEKLKEYHKRLGDIPLLCSYFDRHMYAVSDFSPEMSIAFSIFTVGAILSGDFAIENENLTTNLYYLLTGSTAIGKTQTLNLLTEILIENDTSEKVVNMLRSLQGMLCEHMETLSKVAVMDEFGKFIGANNSKGNPNGEGLWQYILEAFSGFGNKEYKNALLSGQKSSDRIVLNRYCLSIFAITTPETLFQHLSGADAASGLFNRFVFVDSMSDQHESKPPKNIGASDIEIDWTKGINQRKNAALSKQSLRLPTNKECRPEHFFIEIKIKTEQNESLLDELYDEKKELQKKERMGAIYKRYVEQVKKFALVMELTENPNSFSISYKNLKLAREVVLSSIDKSYDIAMENVFDSDFMRAAAAFESVIEGAKTNGILKSDINKHEFYAVHKKEYVEAMKWMLEIGRIFYFKELVENPNEAQRKNIPLIKGKKTTAVHANYLQDFIASHPKFVKAQD